MEIYKFGGASIKNAEAIKKIPKIIQLCPTNLGVVVSAIDKTTNELECLVELYFLQKDGKIKQFEKIKKFHLLILKELFPYNNKVFSVISDLFDELGQKLETKPSLNYDFEYDQIVVFGELLSTQIISSFLNLMRIKNNWIDIRMFIKTNNDFRDAKVDFVLTNQLLQFEKLLFNENVFITQGFIGSTSENTSTTLGREGSDYTASILANLFNASKVTVWKDVPGLLTADPKWMQDSTKIDALTYRETIELAYFGAKVIHPKTIQPLKQKAIPLFIKSFLNPLDEGTAIQESVVKQKRFPVFIRKQNQVLLSLSSKDYSFITEQSISEIFNLFAKNKVRVNITQNSAISFSVCIDRNPRIMNQIISTLQKKYKVLFNENIELISIKHYNDDAIDKMCFNKRVLLEQRSRNTIHIIVADNN